MSYPQRSEILDWVSDRSALVDTAIGIGVRSAIEELDEWPAPEWQASLNELLKLSKKQDAFYDRPTIGPAYAFRYHARRANPLVSQLERLTTVDRGHQALDVVDLGLGTEPLPGQLHSLQLRWLTSHTSRVIARGREQPVHVLNGPVAVDCS